MQLRTDPAAREMLTAMRTMTPEQIIHSFDLTEVCRCDLERYAEEDGYCEEVLQFILDNNR